MRVWLGWQWLDAGLRKVSGRRMDERTAAGAAVAGFANGAIAKAAGENPVVQGWYANFLEAWVLPNSKFFGYLVAYGEVLVGIGLILGAFTGDRHSHQHADEPQLHACRYTQQQPNPVYSGLCGPGSGQLR